MVGLFQPPGSRPTPLTLSLSRRCLHKKKATHSPNCLLIYTPCPSWVQIPMLKQTYYTRQEAARSKLRVSPRGRGTFGAVSPWLLVGSKSHQESVWLLVSHEKQPKKGCPHKTTHPNLLSQVSGKRAPLPRSALLRCGPRLSVRMAPRS